MKTFGSDFTDENGKLNRAKLSALVFSDPNQRQNYRIYKTRLFVKNYMLDGTS